MNILTIDLEDWFHILAHEQTSLPSQWNNFPSRVEENTEWILQRLAEKDIQATFFCLGWIAKRHPKLISKIAAAGHEIACHSMNHTLVYEQSPDGFQEDLLENLNVLEHITGTKVVTYRAPGFSVSSNNKWVFEILTANGIQNDCSIFPASRNHGGYQEFNSTEPCMISSNGCTLREFPMNIFRFAGLNIAFSGGGYFRSLPYSLISMLMKKSGYVMTYFHPRDFDPGQPVLESLPLKRRMMSYTGLKTSQKKFYRLLDDFSFVNVQQAVGEINWNTARTVYLD